MAQTVVSEDEATSTLVVKLDARQWSWLRQAGVPASTMLALLERAIRQDIVKRALRDEHSIELLIRRRHRDLKLRFGDGHDARSLRTVAEDEILASCEHMNDATMRAAAARLRLLFNIRHARGGGARLAKVTLQRLRAERPGGWQETLGDQAA